MLQPCDVTTMEAPLAKRPPKRSAGGDDAGARPSKEEKKKKKKKLSAGASAGRNVGGPSALPPHRYILAPMVGGSELAFRLLCRRYATGDLLCYTPMMSSERFVAEPSYRETFQTNAADRPLVAHFSGNDPKTMLAAARLIEDRVDAVDLNLGCPQRIAHSGHFGSFLLDEVDRPLVLSIIRTLASNLSVPVFAKIRLLATTELTIELVRQLRDAGAKLVAIHARHRVSLVGRSGPTARDGPAFIDEVAKVRAAVGTSVRLVCNGNVRCWADAASNLSVTGADGVMSAEGILDDPAIYFPTISEAGARGGCPGEPSGGLLGEPSAASGAAEAAAARGEASEALKEARRLEKKLRQVERLELRAAATLTDDEREKIARRPRLEAQLAEAKKRCDESRWQKRQRAEAARAEAGEKAGESAAGAGAARPKPTPVQLALEYLDLAESLGVPLKCVVFHVRRMAKHALTSYQMLGDILSAADGADVRAIVERCAAYDAAPDSFVYDADKEKKQREALSLKKWRESARKRFEERMVRKAMRANLPRDHYLKAGAELPTSEGLAELKQMDPAAAWETWKKRHGQHCWALHLEPGGCPRERSCAFLHADIAKPADEANDPSWLQERNSGYG